MRTLILDPSSAGLDELLERRSRSGLDRHARVVPLDRDRLGRPRDTVVIEEYRHLVDDELDDAEVNQAAALDGAVLAGGER